MFFNSREFFYFYVRDNRALLMLSLDALGDYNAAMESVSYGVGYNLSPLF